jgi:uncharacterized protein YndB with AHSA1/START domain
MTAPLRMSFDVACSAGHAFTVWTAGIGAWWPPDHTMTGRAEAVVLQGGVGGRIYERTADGTEHEWGEVIVWQPPARLAYLWYLGRDRADATEVEIRFLVGSTTLKYRLRAIEDLHAWLKARGDWVPLGAADEKKPAADGTVEAWGRSTDNPAWPRSATTPATTGCERSRRSLPWSRGPAGPGRAPSARRYPAR